MKIQIFEKYLNGQISISITHLEKMLVGLFSL